MASCGHLFPYLMLYLCVTVQADGEIPPESTTTKETTTLDYSPLVEGRFEMVSKKGSIGLKIQIDSTKCQPPTTITEPTTTEATTTEPTTTEATTTEATTTEATTTEPTTTKITTPSTTTEEPTGMGLSPDKAVNSCADLKWNVDDDGSWVKTTMLKATCSMAVCVQVNTLISVYWIYPANPFQVHCVIEEYIFTSCLKLHVNIVDEIKRSAVTIQNKPFWLSVEAPEIMKSYYKFDVSHVSYLLASSVNVSQKINYYSINSDVNPSPEKSLQLLLWNDNLVGPTPTDRIPMSYDFNELEDYDDDTIWKTTEITLKTNSANRLPVTDFYIRDTSTTAEEKKISLELKELCFTHKKRKD